MTVKAFYEKVLSSNIVGELQDYASKVTDFTPINQEYNGKLYQSVYAHRVPFGHNIERHIVYTFKAFNDKYFNYDLFGSFEIQLLKYLPDGHYDWHSDYGVSEHPEGDRKLSMSIQLSNMWDYNGGEVRIRDWYNRTHYMEREVGNVMVFDSRAPHKVTPVTHGERMSIVAWAHGPKLR